MPHKLLFLASLFLVLISIYTLLTSRHHTDNLNPKAAALLEYQPDLIVFNSTTDNFTPEGLLKSQLSSPRIDHYEHQNTTLLTKPHLLTFTEKRVPWNINADHGAMHNGTQVIDLTGHVVLHQPDNPTSPETTITTTELTYYPERSFAETHQKVTVVRPGVTISAQGMTVNFKTGIIVTQSQTRGTYDFKK